jgi:hypothetical protein
MEITDEQQKILDTLYYTIDEPTAFRGVNVLYSAAKLKDPSLTLKHVREWLK